MQPQEIFDTVVNHLRTQGKPSQNILGVCFYRSPEGLKCAVGCLIPDEMYDPKMDISDAAINSGTGLYRLISQFKVPDYFYDNKGLLADLQHAHDLDWPILEKALQDIAINHDLTYTPPGAVQ